VSEAGAASRSGGLPHALGDAPAAAALRVACSGTGFARARVFTRDTLRGWSLDPRGDDAVLVVTELISDPGGDMPVFHPSDGSALREHGRGLCIVDALAEEWGWTPRPPAGKTVWATLSTRPLT
jgi:hypothetical protein